MMKRLSLVILLLALLLAACQAAPAPAPTTALEEGGEGNTNSSELKMASPTEGTGDAASGAYPNPVYAYPNPAGPYPGPGGGGTVEWQEAVELINTGQVTQIVQGHDLGVTLTLTDGRTAVTTEPSIDEVLRVIEQCGDPCRNIVVATE